MNKHRVVASLIAGLLALSSVGTVVPDSHADESQHILDPAMKQCLITDGVEKWGMTAPEDGEIGVDWLMAYNQATSDRVGVSDPFYKGNTLKCDGVASLSGLSDLSTSDTYRLELTNSTVEDFSQLEMIPSLRELSVQNSSMERVPDSILWLR